MNTPSVPNDSGPRLHRSIMEEQNRPDAEEPAAPWTLADVPWVTLALLLVNCAVFYAEWRAGQGNIPLISQQFGAKDNALIEAGQIWRFVTPIFLHGSLPHLLMNSISLGWLGSQMESIFGRRKYFLIYLTAGIAGNIASYLRNPLPSLGASGAIFGLVGAGLIFPIRYRALLPEEARNRILYQLFTVAALNLGAGFAMPGVDNFAHMGGLIGGAFATLFLLPDALDERPRRAVRESLLWLSVAAMGCAAVWAGKAQWNISRPHPAALAIVRYAPAEKNPWWTVAVPTQWRLRNGHWVNANGAEMEFTDTTLEPSAGAELDKLAQRPGVIVMNMGINRRETRRLFFKQAERITEIWQIAAYNQRLIFTLKCSAAGYPQGSRDLLAVIATLIVHRAPVVPAAPTK